MVSVPRKENVLLTKSKVEIVGLLILMRSKEQMDLFDQLCSSAWCPSCVAKTLILDIMGKLFYQFLSYLLCL